MRYQAHPRALRLTTPSACVSANFVPGGPLDYLQPLRQRKPGPLQVLPRVWKRASEGCPGRGARRGPERADSRDTAAQRRPSRCSRPGGHRAHAAAVSDGAHRICARGRTRRRRDAAADRNRVGRNQATGQPSAPSAQATASGTAQAAPKAKGGIPWGDSPKMPAQFTPMPIVQAPPPSSGGYGGGGSGSDRRRGRAWQRLQRRRHAGHRQRHSRIQRPGCQRPTAVGRGHLRQLRKTHRARVRVLRHLRHAGRAGSRHPQPQPRTPGRCSWAGRRQQARPRRAAGWS